MSSSADPDDSPEPLPRDLSKELYTDYVDEYAMQVFEQAMNDPDPGSNVELITSVSDFAPIHEKTKRLKKRTSGDNTTASRYDVVRTGWGYSISRWPLLVTILVVIFLEFCAYVWVRQMVNIIEWAWTWRGKRRELRGKLRSATDYPSWKQCALTLDDHLGYGEWKKDPVYAYYDYKLIIRVRENLAKMREEGDAESVRAILEVCLKNNFAGVEGARMYSETYLGSKDLVEEYVDEVSKSLKFLRETKDIAEDEKAAFFRSVTNTYGSTALALSGGASFVHFGVLKAFYDAKLLPRVITGTSAGALVCTRTDEELEHLLVPELADHLTACEESFKVWSKRMWNTGARFDTIKWARGACWFTKGTMTFKEAYERTGRALNVSVIPYDTHSPTKLLNHLTAPDCIIFTAIIASAAVPGIINPVVLLTKSKDGTIRPWEYQGRHKDGSLRVDIPLQSLHMFFNINFSIVSQVNPHIHIFAFSPRGAPGRPVSHRQGKGWRGGFFLSAAESYLKLELLKNFKVIRDLELLPEFYGQNWSAVFLQKFEGTVTIFPRSQVKDFFRLLTDPDRKELARMIMTGQKVTWPRLHMVENRLRIEREIDAGREEFKEEVVVHSTKPDYKNNAPTPTSSTAHDDEHERVRSGRQPLIPPDVLTEEETDFSSHDEKSIPEKNNLLASDGKIGKNDRSNRVGNSLSPTTSSAELSGTSSARERRSAAKRRRKFIKMLGIH